jgi:hypothetical protein
MPYYLRLSDGCRGCQDKQTIVAMQYYFLQGRMGEIVNLSCVQDINQSQTVKAL